MKKFFLKICILMIGGGLFAQEFHCIDVSSEILREATSQYVDFINHLGSDKSFDPSVALICAPDCKKIFNGKLQLQGREAFVAHLLTLKQMQGHWVVKPVDTFIYAYQRAAVIRLMISIEKTGLFTALVILRYNSEWQVEEINEVFSQFEKEENEISQIR